MATMASACAAPSRRATMLQTSFRGEKLGAGSLGAPCLFAEARRVAFPCRVSPQKLQVQAMRRIKGKVVCSSNDKTVSVEVARLYTHPKYKKRIKSSKKYHAHDEENRCQVGDIVTLVSCIPISKTKKFTVSEIISKAQQTTSTDKEPDLDFLLPIQAALSRR